MLFSTVWYCFLREKYSCFFDRGISGKGNINLIREGFGKMFIMRSLEYSNCGDVAEIIHSAYKN